MTGLLYKELRQNKAALIFCAAVPILSILFSLLLPLVGQASGTDYLQTYREMTGRDEESSQNIMILLTIIYGVMMSDLMQVGIFMQDETKKWGYFTASHPKGYRGAIYYKYLLVFLMGIETMVSFEIAMQIFYLADHLILGTTAEEMPVGYSMLFMLLLLMQMFLRMFDLPFFYRFGAKRGANIKASAIAVLIFAGFVYLLFGPLPESLDELALQIDEWLEQFKAGKASDWIYYGLAAFIWVTIIGYNISYNISCKLFMKGVEQYDK